MKPLLIIPPAPLRAAALEGLYQAHPPARLADLRARLAEKTADAEDVLSAIPSGGQMLAAACIRRRGPIGVLGDMLTRPDHRRRGLARALLQTLLSWFDMTGGRWLYLQCESALAAGFFENFGFEPLHRAGREPSSTVVLLRALGGAERSPLDAADGPTTFRQAGPADYPLLYCLAQHRRGPDPRVGLSESALAAEAAIVELLDQAQRGQCLLLAAERCGRFIGLATLATGKLGTRTFAVLAPAAGPIGGSAPPELREAVVAAAAAMGYPTVEFPMEGVSL